MTLAIAAVCAYQDKMCVVLCADWQGTRGSFIKADDTYKIRHFAHAAILFAGDVDAGAEFAAKFESVSRAFNKIQKVEGDSDIRMGDYLTQLRELVRAHIHIRKSHHIAVKYGITLDEFHAIGAHNRFSANRYEEISNDIKTIDLGAEFIFVYMKDEEPILVKIEQSGYVSWDEGNLVAIGSGEPIAMAVLCQVEMDEKTPLIECLYWVYQAKRAAEKNPYVGTTTTIAVMLSDNRECDITDETWKWLKRLRPVVRHPTKKERVGPLGEIITEPTTRIEY